MNNLKGWYYGKSSAQYYLVYEGEIHARLCSFLWRRSSAKSRQNTLNDIFESLPVSAQNEFKKFKITDLKRNRLLPDVKINVIKDDA